MSIPREPFACDLTTAANNTSRTSLARWKSSKKSSSGRSAMTLRSDSLAHVFEGWDGYQTSLVHAIEPLTAAQLEWRAAPGRRSVGELVRHISFGRITWFARMP